MAYGIVNTQNVYLFTLRKKKKDKRNQLKITSPEIEI